MQKFCDIENTDSGLTNISISESLCNQCFMLCDIGSISPL